MTCREFAKKLEGLTLNELSCSADADLLAHQISCASCSALLRERRSLAGAMQVLSSGTAGMRAPIAVEQNVLRAFRQSSAVQPTPGLRSLSAFRWNYFFGWRSYAAAAAVLAICLGLGLWFAQRSRSTSDETAQQQTAQTQQAVQPSVVQAERPAQVAKVHAPASNWKLNSTTNAVAASRPDSTPPTSFAQSVQAQGYTPLMLCDPISCSGDEAVVRMELPTTATDGSTESQMADVIVGDDGLVRAIRIVQQ